VDFPYLTTSRQYAVLLTLPAFNYAIIYFFSYTIYTDYNIAVVDMHSFKCLYPQPQQALFIDDRRDRLAHWSFVFLERFPVEANTSHFHFNLAMTLYGLQVSSPFPSGSVPLLAIRSGGARTNVASRIERASPRCHADGCVTQRRREALSHFLDAICLADGPAPGFGAAGLGMHAGPDMLLRSFHHVAMLLEEVLYQMRKGAEQIEHVCFVHSICYSRRLLEP
jgi:hypothetical protein